MRTATCGPGGARPLFGACAAIAALLAFSGPVSAGTAEAEKALEDAKKLEKTEGVAEAIRAYSLFVTEAPGDERVPWVLVRIGDLQAQANQQKEAMETYRKVTVDHPDAIEARMARARISQIGMGYLEAAKARYNAAQGEEDKMTALWDMGGAYEMMDRPKDAAAQFREIRATSTIPRWQSRAGDKLKEMVSERVKKLASGPPVPSGDEWREIAELAEVAGDWNTAAEYYLKLAELAKDRQSIAENKMAAARCMTMGGKSDKALKLYVELIEGAEDRAEADTAYRAAGMLLENAGRYGEAGAFYRKHSKAVTEAGLPVPAWIKLRQAYCSEQTGDLEAAINGYQGLLETADSHSLSPDALLGMARIYERKRQYESAGALYDRVIAEYAETAHAAKARRLRQDMEIKATEWEQLRDQLGKMSESYPNREREDR